MLNFVLFMIATLAAVVLGNKTKVNMGIWAYLFAFVLGYFRVGKSITGVIGLFPATIYFALISSAIFFGFANANGTMKLMAEKLMYRFRRQVWMGPLIMFVVGSVISLTGVNGTTGLILSSMCYAVAKAMDCHILPVLLVVGAAAGGWGMFPWASAGAANFGAMSAYSEVNSVYFGLYVGGTIGIICELILIIVICLKTKAFRKRNADEINLFEEPAPFNREQRITFWTIIICMLVVVVPTLLNAAIGTTFTKKLTGFFSIYLVWTFGIVFLTLMNLGDLKEMITHRVSWNAVILVTGMSTLFGLAKELGVVDFLGNILNALPSILIVPGLAVVCAVLSFFVSGMLIVPFFAPLTAAFAAASGQSLNAVLVALVAGGVVTCISPVSSGGAYLLSGAPNEEISAQARSGLFKVAIINAILIFPIMLIVQMFI